jgi:hypothetical protein
MTADRRHKAHHPSIKGYQKMFQVNLASPAEVTACKGWTSNAHFHHLGCAMTFARTSKTAANLMKDLG